MDTTGVRVGRLRTISNRNLSSSMDVFEYVMAHGYEKMRRLEGEYRDAAVMTEVFMMAAHSKNCNDTASENPGSISFERTPRNRLLIESRLGCMNMQMTTNTYRAKKTRKNPVTQAIIHAIMCLVDFSDMKKNETRDMHTIVFTDVLSVTHAAMIALIFRCFCLHFDWDPDVTMYLLVSGDTQIAMNVYVGSTMNVEIVTTSDPVMDTSRIINEHGPGGMFIVTNEYRVMSMIWYGFTDLAPHVSIVMDMDTYENQCMVTDMCIHRDMVAEAMPISDPNMSTVRVSTAFMTPDLSTRAYDHVTRDMSMIARMRWFNNMVRHMDIDSLCYDCWIAFRVASSVGRAVMGAEFVSDMYESRKAYRDFSTTVTVSRTAS